jgi:hypothetical protein
LKIDWKVKDTAKLKVLIKKVLVDEITKIEERKQVRRV